MMFRSPSGVAVGIGGRADARRYVATAVVIAFSAVAMPAIAVGQNDPLVRVTEDAGVYSVAATFTVPQAGSFAHAALTDYAEIPRFMPAVRTSRVLERGDRRAVVEQEAVARFMMFSKSIHLVLEVHEDRGAVRFRDRGGQSFTLYEGMWTISEREGETRVTYELAADPSFDVPEFLLKRLLQRDAGHMIERLKGEIEARARQHVN
jgi:ribosome-associated toxin RatA of RatAB toxin-antitoxin module